MLGRGYSRRRSIRRVVGGCIRGGIRDGHRGARGYSPAGEKAGVATEGGVEVMSWAAKATSVGRRRMQ